LSASTASELVHAQAVPYRHSPEASWYDRLVEALYNASEPAFHVEAFIVVMDV
jgi:hypothetical protein